MTLVFLSIIVLSFYFLKSRVGIENILQPNIYSVLVLFHLIFHVYIGTYLISSSYSRNSVINQISNPDLIITTFYYISLSILLLYLGFKFSDLFFKNKSSIIFRNYLNKPLENYNKKGENFLVFLFKILLLICLVSAIYVTYVNGEIPFMKLLFNSQNDLLLSRNDYNLNFKGIRLIKNVIFEQLTLLLCLFFFALKNKNNSYKYWFYFSFLLSIYAAIFSGAKSPIIVLFINLLILRYYLVGKISSKKILQFILAILILILTIIILAAGDSNLTLALEYLFNRVFIDEVSGTFLMFDIYPRGYDHIYFQSLSEFLSNLFGIEKIDNAQRTSMLYAFGDRAESGLFNQLSTYFLGEAWANFGYYGIIVGPIYVGFILGFFINFIIRIKKSFLTVSILTYFSFSSSISSQFNNFIYNSNVIIISIIILFIVGYSSIFIKDFYSKEEKLIN
jgi:oligosaccharide repeat unit polymerase